MADTTTQPEVGFEEHPACSEAEGSEGQDEEAVEESGPLPTPKRNTRSKTRAGDVNDESEGEGLSDRDEAMSEGD
jgi:hypothetical protein